MKSLSVKKNSAEPCRSQPQQGFYRSNLKQI